MDNYQPYFNAGELIAKYLRDGLTEQESNELGQWLGADPHNQELFDKLVNDQYVNEQLAQFSLPEKQNAWNNIAAKTGFEKKKQATFEKRGWLPYAAAALLLLGIGTVLIKSSLKKTEANPLAHHSVEIRPGGNKATLTLSNGQKIALGDVRDGTIARQEEISINKTSDGEIVYETQGHSAVANQLSAAKINLTNVISTPRGGQYAVVLPDGSKVWLNAASSLTYPIEFTGNDRSVELTGEAYFEVAKDAKRPFFVKTADQTVRVLGTHFNINSYDDEKATKTTLLEGSVKITTGENAAGVTLVPEQQAINILKNVNIISHADVNEAVAWKNGKFLFRNTELKTIMRQLSRWYDVDVEYRGTITAKHYVGTISRDVPLTQIFEILKTSGLNFTIDGRTIIVK